MVIPTFHKSCSRCGWRSFDRSGGAGRLEWERSDAPSIRRLCQKFSLPIVYRGKCLKVHFARPQEVEKANPLVLACFTDAQQHEVLPNPLGRTVCADHVAEPRKSLDRVLRVVVIPWHTIMVQERK